MTPKQKAAALERIRRACFALPDVTERASHGAPTWFIKGKKSFCNFLDDHHGDGRIALWCCCTLDAQAALIDANPDVYFRPPYVGHTGWVGVRLDRKAPWSEIARAIEAAYATRAGRAA
jgi:hypothetical protein